MLPRSENNRGIVVFTEILEILNISCEFSRDHVFEVLKWLVANNPLYKDVFIDKTANSSKDDLIVVTENDCPSSLTSLVENNQDFGRINDGSGILQASWY